MSQFNIEKATNEGIKISNISFSGAYDVIKYRIYENNSWEHPPAALLPGTEVGGSEFSDENYHTWDEASAPMDDIETKAFSEIAAVAIKDGKVVGYERKTLTDDVIKAPSDENLVNMDADELEIWFNGSDEIDHVTQDVGLPFMGYHGSGITWSSSNTSVIQIDSVATFGPVGKVVRPSADTNVTLTATITINTVHAAREFHLTVKAALVPPTVTPQSIDFNDLDENSGKIGGTITWTGAVDEENVTAYVVKYLNSDNEVVQEICSVNKGETYQLEIPSGTDIPMKDGKTASKIAVFSRNEAGDSSVFQSVDIQDHHGTA
jgi:hypothetical protein